MKKFNDEVYFAEGSIVTVGEKDIELLKRTMAQNKRFRIRLCAHKNPGDAVHEMFIVLGKGAYVRPHKHLTKTESFHILEGKVDVVVFDDSGRVDEVIHMGDYKSGLPFYYRISEPVFHTLIPRSDHLVFKEAANGPYNREDAAFPAWAPTENDSDEGRAYVEALSRKAGKA